MRPGTRPNFILITMDRELAMCVPTIVFVNTLHETGPSNMLGNVSECTNVKHDDFSDARDKDITDMK